VLAAFSFADPPFDGLNPEARGRLAAAADVGWYPRGAVVADAGTLRDDFVVVLSGAVAGRHGAEVVASFEEGDVLGGDAFSGLPEDTVFVAAEDTVCHLVPAPVLQDLIRTDPGFSDAFARFAAGHGPRGAGAAAARPASFPSVRLRDLPLRRTPWLDTGATARDAAAAMKEAGAPCVLLRRGEAVGLLDGRDLLEACVLEGGSPDAPVGPLVRWDPASAEADDLLVDALAAAAGGSPRRLVIRDGGTVAGVLEEADLLRAAADPPHLLAVEIGQAAGLAGLERAARDLLGLVRTLHARGAGIHYLGEVVTELNIRVMRRLFDMLAPPDLAAGACLIVMGSEGRGEQILKTDQDNGLILREGLDFPGLEAVAAEFTRVLTDMGWPECPGGIMVRNPAWRRTLPAWKEVLHDWVRHPGEDALLNLAVFYDARAAAGDAALLASARAYLTDLLAADDIFFSRFALPVLSFDTPVGLFSTLRGARIDVKKGGIFPIVHGVRSLAIQNRLDPVNTFERIWALEARGVLDRGFAAELDEALSVMMALRLKPRLDLAQDPRTVTRPDNLIRPNDLTRLERDMLRDALTTAKRFKEFVSYHFHLDLF
jgi:CBS domain-containing protein